MTNADEIPDAQCAVQLTGPDRLELNARKPVHRPIGRQILARVRAVGLCFSDLKLLKQFDQHPRKGPVLGGMEPAELEGLPSYVPGAAATVPGHEVAATIVALGGDVRHHALGETVIVQADFRHLPTAGSNAAFGYNFEGGLQEYILLDERVVVDGEGQRFLIPAEGSAGASEIALVEPWACVENSYVTSERRTLKPGGHMLVVVEGGHEARGICQCLAPQGSPARATLIGAAGREIEELRRRVPVDMVASESDLPESGFDDIVYFGTDKDRIDALNDRLATGGIFCIVTTGGKIDRPVSVGIGRVHYGSTRWIGSVGDSAEPAYRAIPPLGELRPQERVLVVGAAGPMGQMHTIRNLSAGVAGVAIVAVDFDDERLDALRRKAGPIAHRLGVQLDCVNPATREVPGPFTYFSLMVPQGAVVDQAIAQAGPGALINIFAGIPAPVRQELDLDTYLAKGCYMFGTSGSRIADMKLVLDKVLAGRLDTNASVDAVCGMAGAVEGIRAVENRSIAGKIVVYPQLRRMGLIPLERVGDYYPSVAARLADGRWTPQAEAELLAVAS